MIFFFFQLWLFGFSDDFGSLVLVIKSLQSMLFSLQTKTYTIAPDKLSVQLGIYPTIILSIAFFQKPGP